MTTIYDDLPAYAENFARPRVGQQDARDRARRPASSATSTSGVEDPYAQTEVKEQAARSQAEIGWGLHPDHQGQGYAVEAVRALLGICFDEPPQGLGLRRVIALCFADNEPSWRLMEKVRMRREAHTGEGVAPP